MVWELRKETKNLNEKELKIILLTHGGWGMSLVKSLEMILGKIDCCCEIPLKPEYTFEEYCQLVEECINKFDSHSIVLTDLLGGSTSNAAIKICFSKGIKVFTGLNAPLLLEACSQLQFRESFDYEQLLKVGQESCHDAIEEMTRKLGK